MADAPPLDSEEELALVLAELSDRALRGEEVDLEGIVRQKPHLASGLRELWGAVMLANAVGSHVSKAGFETIAPPDHDSWQVLPTLPCRWGDFDLLDELGRGGMGVVYKAHQLSLHRDVALKMILRGQLATSADLARFQAEAAAAARLDHPYIVPVYEAGELGDRAYFTMKFIEGETLAERLAEGPLPAREAARLLMAIAEAIDYAHSRGVLHRDLKPSNILIDSRGQPHVTDFGLAKQVTDAATLTRTGAILGTPAYMAPEQAAGDRGQVGPASDVYSLGSILYHMLTGRPPFQAATPVDTVLLVLEQDPLPPSVLNPLADLDLEMICLRCLQKPPELRYASAAALAADLSAFLNHEPISARSGQFGEIVASLFRETHHAVLLENWGLLWMWHSLVLLGVSTATNLLHLGQGWLWGVEVRWPYILLWTLGLGTWAAVFWALRQKVGPVTFVERQVAHVWAGGMICNAMLFPVEWLLDFPVLKLSPILALSSGMVFMVKAGILTGQFYLQSAAMFGTAILMCLWPEYAHFIFGVVAALCFFVPGLHYYRQRVRALAERGG